MSYVRLTDAQTAAKHFLTQSDLRQFRDNEDDFDTRINSLLGKSFNSFADDFLTGTDGAGAQSWIDTAIYETSAGTTGMNSRMETDGGHIFEVTSTASAITRYLALQKTKCRVRLNQDMAFFMEFRVKEPGATVMSNLMFGLQDRSVVTPATEADVIGFFKGTSAGKWRFRVASGGVQTETDNIGNRATWQKLRFEFLRSGGGGTLQVRAYIDGAEISGSPFTTNIPTGVVMKPFLGAVSPGAGTTQLWTDRWEIGWTAQPLAA